VKTENLSACVTVDCKACGNSGSAVLPVLPSCLNNMSISAIIQSNNSFYKTRNKTLHVTIRLSGVVLK
jgi:hypothetical protein